MTILETQPDFEAGTAETEGASTTRRPDAISSDYLTAVSFGPVRKNDPSGGPLNRAWRVRYDPESGDVLLARSNDDGDAWVDEEVLFGLGLADPTAEQIDVAFSAVKALLQQIYEAENEDVDVAFSAVTAFLEATASDLVRTTSGKVARHVAADATDPFDTVDWSVNAAVSNFAVNASGELTWDNSSSTQGAVQYDPAGALAEAMIQLRGEGSNQAWLGAGFFFDDQSANADWDPAWSAWEIDYNDRHFLHDRLADAHMTPDSPATVPEKASNTPYRLSVWMDRISENGGTYDFDSGSLLTGTLQASRASDLPVGLIGVKSNRRVQDFYIHATKFVTVKGVPSGGKAQIRDGADVLLAEATESGGDAEIDVLNVWMLDAVTVEVRDSGGSLVADISSPTGGIWGGDVYVIEGTYMGEVLIDSPVGYWRLGEGSGTVAVDETGNGNDGTYHGSPTLGATGALAEDADTAVSCDGMDDDVDLTVLGTLGSDPTRTFEFWIKTTETGQVWAAGTVNDGTATYWMIGLNMTTGAGAQAGSTVVRVRDTADDKYDEAFTEDIYDGLWHHIAIAQDGHTSWRILVDGVQVSPTTQGTGYDTPADWSYGLMFGARNVRGVAGGHADVVLDEIAVYDKALSNTRIQAHYDAGVGS